MSACLCHSGKSYASGGRFDLSSERWRTRGLEISSGRRRLRHHQSPSTDNSHQEALRTSWRMDIASYEDRSDPESLRMERTEKDHTLFEDRESELRTMNNKVTGED